jgi:hypothetical protein
MTTVTTFENTFPPDDEGSPTLGERLVVARFLEEVRGQIEADQIDQAWAARSAELAAYDETVTVLGTEVADVAVWDGNGDGTASGVIDHLAARWTPTGGITVVRRCPSCATTATVPVVGLDQLVTDLGHPCDCGGAR